ncbi:glutaredoxin 3 [Nematocida minor]|uniref:glutaredoxin 3 n=1 Tax=Nematocida minor TaxID=1912983 RepID=UPI00221ED668|nr:glutaredoxin 3 [Nematocida minor]KAI5192055.1 glutaredoxin 3 [Nematocida minor]
MGEIQVSKEDLIQLKTLILSEPIFAAISKTCKYCTMFMSSMKELKQESNLFIMNKDTHGLLFDKLRHVVKEVYKHRTVPIIFIKGRFIGGFSDFQKYTGNIKGLLALESLEKALVFTEEGKLL